MTAVSDSTRRLIIGMAGSSGIPYGIRLLEVLQGESTVTTHLVMTNAAKLTCSVESDASVEDVEALADVVHNVRDVGASIASGSFITDGMIVAPCSMRTLSSIVNSYADNLLTRAADVVLKERRRLVLMPRETPLHVGHCRLFYEAAQMGAVLCPPVPAFYNRPETIDVIVDQAVGRVLDLFAIDTGVVKRWQGVSDSR